MRTLLTLAALVAMFAPFPAPGFPERTVILPAFGPCDLRLTWNEQLGRLIERKLAGRYDEVDGARRSTGGP